jgi:hypothetical protein
LVSITPVEIVALLTTKGFKPSGGGLKKVCMPRNSLMPGVCLPHSRLGLPTAALYFWGRRANAMIEIPAHKECDPRHNLVEYFAEFG